MSTINKIISLYQKSLNRFSASDRHIVDTDWPAESQYLAMAVHTEELEYINMLRTHGHEIAEALIGAEYIIREVDRRVNVQGVDMDSSMVLGSMVEKWLSKNKKLF